MEKISQFFKVSKDEFLKNASQEEYENIVLPKRATCGSAGYDFFLNSNLSLKSGQTITIPTGIRVKIDNGYFLAIFPRSSLGFKYRLRLDNTVGIIDSDYYFAENEGHIFVKITNCGDKDIYLEKGKAFCQGVFIPFGITVDDDCQTNRTGGLGSTDKQ